MTTKLRSHRRSMNPGIAIVIVASFALPSTLSGQFTPAGDEFQVNTYTTANQGRPHIAADSLGDFLIVWQSLGSSGTDSDQSSIQAQWFASDGSPVGLEAQVNTYTTNSQRWPAVATASAGDLVVVWESLGSSGSDTSDYSIQAQRFDADGLPVGPESQVNSYTTNGQRATSVAVDGLGNFIVVWGSLGSSGSDSDLTSIQAQRYDPYLNPLGTEFQVNTYTTSLQLWPVVAADASGNFVVIWDSLGSSGTDTSGYSIQAQRYDVAANPIGEQFQVNSYTTGDQGLPEVAMDTVGNFVVVWTSAGSSGTDTSGSSVHGQRYDSDGDPAGPEFQVNSYTTNDQSYQTVATAAGGDFVVAWQSLGSSGNDNSGTSIQAQQFTADGTPVGSQIQVNTQTLGHQQHVTAAADTCARFVLTWGSATSSGNDNSGTSIQARRYHLGLPFLDGFESGDTNCWTRALP